MFLGGILGINDTWLRGKSLLGVDNSITNANTGVYTVYEGANYEGFPAGAYQWGILIVARTGDGGHIQIYSETAMERNVYVREAINGKSYSVWRKINTTVIS